jgi:hypothetical protein
MIFQNHRRVPVSLFRVTIAASEPLQRFTGRIFKLSKYGNFLEASEKFTIISYRIKKL